MVESKIEVGSVVTYVLNDKRQMVVRSISEGQVICFWEDRLHKEQSREYRIVELQKRNLKLGKQRKDEYANALFDFQQKGGDAEGRMLDQLLTMALIEARSCERFKRLSEGLNDGYMQKFYRRFMESEAGHYTLFIELAETYINKDKVRRRWKEWLDYEADIIQNLEVRGDRMH